MSESGFKLKSEVKSKDFARGALLSTHSEEDDSWDDDSSGGYSLKWGSHQRLSQQRSSESKSFLKFDSHNAPFSTSEAIVPVFNPAASTSLLQNMGAAAKTAEQIVAENFVRGLLVFQNADGHFVFNNEKILEKSLGSPFVSVVIGLRAKLDVFDTIVTIAIIALLEDQFQICQGLWVLMIQKAESYISACHLGPKGDALRQEARNGIKLIPSVMQKVTKPDELVTTAIELEIAPLV